MMKTSVVVTAVILLNSFFCKAQNLQFTLKECIETALKNNIGIRQGEVLKNNAGLVYSQSKNNRLPIVQSTYSYGINNGRSIDPFTNGYINQQLKSSNMDVNASVPLFSGFQLKNTIRQNELAFAGATMEWQQRKDELTLQVILAYLQVLSSQDAITLAKQQAIVTKEQVNRIEIVSAEGATSPSNASDLKGQYAGDKLALVNAESNFQSAVLALTQLMNVAYTDKIVFDRQGMLETVQQYDAAPDEIYAAAIEKLAAVKATDLRVKSNAMAVKAAVGNSLPAVSLFGGASTNYSSAAMLNTLTGSKEVSTGDYVTHNGDKLNVISQQNNFSSKPISYSNQFNNNISTGFGVSVRIPVFNAFRNRTTVRLAKNDEQSSRLVAENIKLQLRQSIDQAYINITATYKRYQSLLEQRDAFEESLRITAERFESGVINAPEYLIAKNNFERTSANIITARYEYLLRKKILDFYMGRLN